MTLFHILLTSGLVLALNGGAAQAQPSAQDTSRAASKPMLSLQTPALPDLARVTRTPTTTADYEQVIGFYQILNQGNGNLTNQPLKPKAPTLSRTDMITFQ